MIGGRRGVAFANANNVESAIAGGRMSCRCHVRESLFDGLAANGAMAMSRAPLAIIKMCHGNLCRMNKTKGSCAFTSGILAFTLPFNPSNKKTNMSRVRMMCSCWCGWG